MKYLKLFELNSSTYKNAADKYKNITNREDDTYKSFMGMHKKRKEEEEFVYDSIIPKEIALIKDDKLRSKKNLSVFKKK